MKAKFKKRVLKNCLRIITIPKKESETVNLLVLAETGSKYESPEEAGLSHFLEHMFFKGTKHRPKAGDISTELDAMGAENNAYTSQELTGYYATVQPKLADKVLDVLADMYLNATFPEADIAKESGVIIEEMNMYEDLPKQQAQKLFFSLLYGDQPAGRPIIGSKKTVRSFTQKDFINYRAKHYVAEATVVVVAGKFNEALMVKKIAKQFKGISTVANLSKSPVIESQTKPAIAVKRKDSDQTHLILGFRTFAAGHQDTETVDLLAAVLGGGMSSRLFRKIRDELGAAYYVSAYNDYYTDHGVLNIPVGTDNKRVEEIVKVILEECRKLTTTLISKSELDRAKESMLGKLFLSLERSSGLAAFYGGEEIIRGQLESPETMARKTRAITPRQVRAVAQKIFTNENLNLALVGPFNNSGQFEPILHL